MKKNGVNIWIVIVLIVIVGAGAFYGGMQYQQSQRAAGGSAGQYAQGAGTRQGFGRAGGTGGAGGGRGFGGATVGEITSIDADSVTLKLQDGSSKIVNMSDKTTISKTDTASKSDLKTGMRIAAIGTSNTDGSISAMNIQLNPQFRTPGQPSPAK